MPLLLLLLPLAEGAERFDGKIFYLGDLHVHTAASGDGLSSDREGCEDGGCGSIGGLVETARANGLDFFSITDHMNGDMAGAADDFQTIHQLMLGAHDPQGGLVTIPGVELHLRDGAGAKLGHKNMYMFGENAALAGLGIEQIRPNGQDSQLTSDCQSLWDWRDAFEDSHGPVALIPHHPGTSSPMPTDWNCFDAYAQPAVEIYSIHGNSLFDGATYDPPASGFASEGVVHAALDPRGRSLRMGFIASTDNHKSHPGEVCSTDVILEQPGKYGGGLMVAVLDESEIFDRPALYDALVERRTYATSGPMIPASVTYLLDDRYAGELGDELGYCAGETFEVRVQVPIDAAFYVFAADAIAPDSDYEMEEVAPGDWRLTFEAPPPWVYVRLRVNGDLWYGLEGCDDGGQTSEERIWMSPSWLHLMEHAECEILGASSAFTLDSGFGDEAALEAYDDGPWPEEGDGWLPGDADPAGSSQGSLGVTYGPWPEELPACGLGGAGGLWWMALLAAARRREG